MNPGLILIESAGASALNPMNVLATAEARHHSVLGVITETQRWPATGAAHTGQTLPAPLPTRSRSAQRKAVGQPTAVEQVVERIDVVVEAEPTQVAELKRRLSQVVSITSVRLVPASHEPIGIHLLIEVIPETSLPTRAEIQRVATENNVLLRHCGPTRQAMKKPKC